MEISLFVPAKDAIGVGCSAFLNNFSCPMSEIISLWSISFTTSNVVESGERLFVPLLFLAHLAKEHIGTRKKYLTYIFWCFLL